MSLKYEKLIRKMTLAEKAVMMSGKNTWETVDFEKYGIPSMVMSDGPHGLRRLHLKAHPVSDPILLYQDHRSQLHE